MQWVVEELHVQGPRALVHRECVRGPEVRGMRAGFAAASKRSFVNGACIDDSHTQAAREAHAMAGSRV